MPSRKRYARFLPACDAEIAASFETAGVDGCNWDVTPHLGTLGPSPGVRYLNAG